jgi:hypothetical protein
LGISPHPRILPIVKHEADSYHEIKHILITRHRKGRGSYTYSLKVGVCLYLTPYQHALQPVGIKFMMFATMTGVDEVYNG